MENNSVKWWPLHENKCLNRARTNPISRSSFTWSRRDFVQWAGGTRAWPSFHPALIHLHGSCAGCSSHLHRFNILSALICSLRPTRFLSLTPPANPPVLNEQNLLKLPLFELYLQHVRDHRVSRRSAPLTILSVVLNLNQLPPIKPQAL